MQLLVIVDGAKVIAAVVGIILEDTLQQLPGGFPSCVLIADDSSAQANQIFKTLPTKRNCP